jgi:hypothetical protein
MSSHRAMPSVSWIAIAGCALSAPAILGGAFSGCGAGERDASTDVAPIDPPAERAPDPTPVIAAPPAPHDDWPEGLPVIPGGTPVEAETHREIRVAIRAYDTPPETLDALFHDELARTGWDVTRGAELQRARRFVARREGREIAISIYVEDGRTRIQAMLFD